MSNSPKPTDSLKHPSDKRVAIPTTERAGEEASALGNQPSSASYRTFREGFVRGRDPELYWLNKYANDSEDTCDADLRVDIRSLYVHEDVQPEQLIDRLYRTCENDTFPPLFEDLSNEVDDELQRVAEYYRHSSDWKNRLIQGDSLLVMNSLLNREGMAGKVQCIYIDPPYGIKYGSNWQMKLNSREVKDNDESLSGEPEMIKAFRDTWELGIHSYLSYLRDRLVLAHELLSPSGSVFIQISDDNVHLVRNLLDEIFHSENFVSQIVYQKTAGAGSPGELTAPAAVCDYILWYAKDKENYKYRKLFNDKVFGVEAGSMYSKIELESGERMSISEWERKTNQKFDYNNRPKGSKIWRTDNLTSQSGGDNARFPIELDGETFTISQGSWKTNKEGILKLIKNNRIIKTKGKAGIAYVRYLDDFPCVPLNCLWTDTTTGGFNEEKLYVVQSTTKAIQRCILMTTDPGDLVLDPTCGSGTTAYVAEQWGRRWITIDTSRIAISIAKKRLMLGRYPYYTLADPDGKDVRYGFCYKTVPHVTLRSIANDEEPEKEILYDQPQEDRRKVRVSGPFTVDTLQSGDVISPEELDSRSDEAEESRIFQERIFQHLQASGIRNGDATQHVRFYGLETMPDPYLHARGYYRDNEDKERLVYFHIGPKFGTVSKNVVNHAVREFRTRLSEGASWLVILGFSFEDNINDHDYNLGTFTVSKVRMHDDLMQDGLLKRDRAAGSFITIGEPDIQIVRDSPDKCHIEICGLDIYDPVRDIVKPRSVEDIAYWEIDDNYDGTQYIVRSIHFCGGDKKEFDDWRRGLGSLINASTRTKKKAEATLRLEFNEEVWETLYTTRSEPIPYEPGRQIAVRVISQFGEESSKVLTIPFDPAN